MPQNRNFVLYSEFGAVGDGRTDDFAAINSAHEYANELGLTVKGDAGAAYYIGAHTSTIEVRTDVDWSGSTFIFDDRYQPLEDREIHIFHIGSAEPYGDAHELGINSVRYGQRRFDIALKCDYYVSIDDATTRRFIREGLNQNDGFPQTDCFILRQDGSVDPATPIIWDFDRITSSKVHPLDEAALTIKGGTIITLANQSPSNYTYYTTNILIERSNVRVTGLKHFVQGELDHGAPYDGILQVNYCANVVIEDCLFTAHYIYETIGAAGKPVNMGSYDVRQRSAVNVTYRSCAQTTDILDRRYWGVFVSDFCKNLTLENCVFSRFDAHMGVTNAAIKGCTLGHQCLNAIGNGILTIEDSTLYGANFIVLRPDYGSTWRGDVIIKNCRWNPRFGDSHALINGYFSGQHDFGYECFMPQRVSVDGLTIDCPQQVYLFGKMSDAATYKFPYHITRGVEVAGLKFEGGASLALSPNERLFDETEIVGI